MLTDNAKLVILKRWIEEQNFIKKIEEHKYTLLNLVYSIKYSQKMHNSPKNENIFSIK